MSSKRIADYTATDAIRFYLLWKLRYPLIIGAAFLLWSWNNQAPEWAHTIKMGDPTIICTKWDAGVCQNAMSRADYVANRKREFPNLR